MSEFTAAVIKQISLIPAGRVATYKQIAELTGKPQAPRGVSWILHTCSTSYKLPWHRVLNSQGRISFEPRTHNFKQQKNKLTAEGVQLSSDGQLSLAKFQWNKKVRKKKSSVRKPKIFQK
ncbi:MAG: MGMT family protein [Bdellovibrio sp.]|nr:MGMT family protein [Bdellovibrio sp.]